MEGGRCGGRLDVVRSEAGRMAKSGKVQEEALRGVVETFDPEGIRALLFVVPGG